MKRLIYAARNQLVQVWYLFICPTISHSIIGLSSNQSVNLLNDWSVIPLAARIGLDLEPGHHLDVAISWADRPVWVQSPGWRCMCVVGSNFHRSCHQIADCCCCCCCYYCYCCCSCCCWDKSSQCCCCCCCSVRSPCCSCHWMAEVAWKVLALAAVVVAVGVAAA